MGEDCELLFFDTFSHDSCEELNLDLVQFPHPVYIFEIRVIPLGARVQADFPGGHRLGATNPSSFKLEFFANDLSKRNACTFEQLGSLEYKQNVEIQFSVTSKIPTDGLVLRGLYSAVTLAVYGVLTKPSSKERSAAVPPPPSQPSTCSQPQDHHHASERSVTDAQVADWDRHPRPVETVADSSSSSVHPHNQSLVDTSRYSEVPSVIHPKTEPHVQYPSEHPQPVYPDPPPPNIVYPECIPASVPSVPPPPPVSYGAYDSRYQKTWPSTEEHYHSQPEGYDPQVYNRPPDTSPYMAPTSVPHAAWEPKECHTGDVARPDHDPYDHDHKSHARGKDWQDKPWDRDSSSSDYNKDDDLSREHGYKRKEQEHRSWDRSSSESDRYRDRERNKESSSRERDRSRDLGRDRQRSHDSYGDRAARPPVKRPVTPPTSPPPPPSSSSTHTRTPQTPPEVEKPTSGPRTPKEEEPQSEFEDKESSTTQHSNQYGGTTSPERARAGEYMYNLSEGEVQEGDNTEDDDGYEEIVSEEEIMSDGEDRVLDMGDMEYDLGDESWNYMSSFSPYHCELTSCQFFEDPTLTLFELLRMKKDKASEIDTEKTPKENKLLDMVKQFEERDHTEKWVEAIESLNSQTISECLAAIDSEKTLNDVVDTLISWAVEGLDFELALKQPQTAYKVRHLKAGVHVSSLLFRISQQVTEKLLAREIPKFLLQLMDQPHMTLPLKLLIIRALDSVASSKQGFLFLLEKKLEFSPPVCFDPKNQEVNNNMVKTGYQKLLECLTSRQLTRAVVAMSALLEKVHLFEVLQELQESLESITHSSHLEPPKPSATPVETIDDNSNTIEAAPLDDIEVDQTETSSSSSWEENAQIIITCLNKITSCYHHAWKSIAQHKRFLPSKTQFELPKSPYDPYPGLLQMLKQSNLLDSILLLLSSPALTAHLGIMSAVRDLFMDLLRSQKGMLFLLFSSESTNGIQKSLLQNLDESRDDAAEENIAHSIGLQIVYRLQALLYIDTLFCHHAKKKELDDPEAVSALHHMYTMIFSPVGRTAVVDVLSNDDNLSALLPFIQIAGDEEAVAKASKSVCAGYVTELLMLTMHSSENVAMLEKFSEALHSISQQESTPKLHDLALWLSPVKNLTSYSHESVPALASVIKCHLEDAASLPPELITAVRVLKHICVPPDPGNEELRYMYATIQFFANDGLSYLVTILQNICDVYLKPSHQSVALVGQPGILLIALVKPTVSLLKNILGHLISSRQNEFKDLTAIPVLLHTFSLMMMVPPSSFAFPTAHAVQEEVIEALLTYTQPCIAAEESDEALNKSLWTQMVQEVLKYIQQSPRTFITGLSVFSELLPLPLPLQTREPLKTEEISRTVNHRKLWSAHLHSVSGKVQEIIRGLAASSSHPLQQLLRRICIQLADLATPSALVVVRAVLDALLETCETETEETADGSAAPASSSTAATAPSSSAGNSSAPHGHAVVTAPCSSSTTRILNLVSYLVSHAAFKVPLMHIIKASTKADEKYADLLSVLLNWLNLASDKPSHIQSQECIVSILQTLCDPDIGFITVESGATVSEVVRDAILSSCLPAKEHMLQICTALVQHISCHSHVYASILPSLRSLVMLNEHDYGFYHVKIALEQNPGKLLSLFQRLSSSFSKESSDYLSTLSTTLDFLRLMINGYEEGAQTGRSMLMHPTELASLLTDQSDDDKARSEKEKSKKPMFQPLFELEKFLSEAVGEEDAVESLLESISSLLLLLNSEGNEEKPDNKDCVEPVLPPPDSLTNQFAARPIFIVGEVEEERLSPAYWLSVPVTDEADQEQEQATVDLVTLAEKYISSDFDLKAKLEALCSSSDADADLKKEKGLSYGTKRKYPTLINPSVADAGIKKPFIAPMRGRGFARATTHSTRANDPFRSRPPNTSRPPSMHVDDFLALESSTDAATPAQQKRPDGSRGRGRGFDRVQAFPSVRGNGNGGRFFSPPGPYGRREPSSRGVSRGSPRISSSAWASRTAAAVLKSPTSIGVRTGFSTRPGVAERCAYGDPFVPPDLRLAPQRSRDPYTDVELTPEAISLRFSRGVRAASTLSPAVPGHWQETRNKAQNQRFLSSAAPTRGGGRRDLNGRHARSFTR